MSNNNNNQSQNIEEDNMDDGLFIIIKKYPKYNTFIESDNGFNFKNLLIAILVLKNKLGHDIDKDETFYTHMINFDLTIFDNIEFKNDLQQLLITTIKLGIIFIGSSKIDEDSKNIVYEKLVNYKNP